MQGFRDFCQVTISNQLMLPAFIQRECYVLADATPIPYVQISFRRCPWGSLQKLQLAPEFQSRKYSMLGWGKKISSTGGFTPSFWVPAEQHLLSWRLFISSYKRLYLSYILSREGIHECYLPCVWYPTFVEWMEVDKLYRFRYRCNRN